MEHIEHSPYSRGGDRFRKYLRRTLLLSRGVFRAHRRPWEIREGFMEEVTPKLRFERRVRVSQGGSEKGIFRQSKQNVLRHEDGCVVSLGKLAGAGDKRPHELRSDLC